MRLLPLVLISTLLLPAAAQAGPKPDRAALISAASPSFAWDGEQATAAAPQQSAQGFDPELCSKEPGYYCDVTLVRLEAAADTTASLEFAIFDFSVPVADFDISIFKSDEAATPGEFIANGGNLSAAGLEETVTLDEAEPGYYLVTVSYYFSPDASYKGTIKGTGITAPPAAAPVPAPSGSGTGSAPGPGGDTSPLPLTVVRSRLGSARTATRRRFLPLRLKAGAAIESLTLALRDGRGRIVASARLKRLPAGSRTVRLRVARRLRKGRHSLVAIGVSGGQKRTAVRRVSLGA